jgi:hypothetical protein
MKPSTLLIMIAGSVGGAVGWWAGDFMGIFAAWMLSLVGTAAAMYFTRRATKTYLP